MASQRGEGEVLKFLLDYESNLESESKKDLKHLTKIEKKLKENKEWVDERVKSGKKLSTQTKNAIARREKANKQLIKKVQQVEKHHKVVKDLLKVEQQITREKEKQAKASSKQEASTISKAARRQKASNSFLGAFDSEFSTSFGHKVGTTAQYIAAGAGILSVAQAFQSLGSNIAQTDLQLRTMAAVLDLSVHQASKLSESVHELGETYGGTLESIDQVALSLGRAGIANDKIVKSTEVVIQMARLTGDTFEQSADAIISFQQVFGDTTSIQSLGDKLAYVANVSRLSTQDIGTLSNYALAAAKNVGLTEDAVGGLAAAFSNAGVNASTIGTQIRRFTTLLSDNSTAVNSFFEGVGVNQANMLSALQRGGEESNRTIIEFSKSLQDLDDTEFTNLIGGMDILASNSLQLLRNNASNVETFITDLQEGVEGQLAATDKILGAYVITLESFWNKVLNMSETNSKKLVKGFETIFTTARGGYAALFGDIAKFNKINLALQLDIKANEIAEITNALNNTTDVTKRINLQKELNKLIQDEYNLKRKLDPSTGKGKERSEFDAITELRAYSKQYAKAFSAGNLAAANNLLKTMEKLSVEYSKLSGKSQLAPIAKVKGATTKDVSSNLVSQITAGKGVTSAQLTALDATYQREVDLINIAKDKQLAKLNEAQQANIRKLSKGGLAGLTDFASQLSAEANASDDAELRKQSSNTINVVNKIVELTQRENEVKNEVLKVTKAQNSAEKTRASLVSAANREALKVKKAHNETSILQAQLNGQEFTKVELLKTELNEQSKQLGMIDDELEREKMVLEIHKTALSLQKAKTAEKIKQQLIGKAATDEAIRHANKLRDLAAKDYSGVGLNRTQNLGILQNALRDSDAQVAQKQRELDKLPKGTVRYNQALKSLNSSLETQKDLQNQVSAEQRKLNDALGAGATDALKSYAITAMDTYEQVNSVVTNSVNSMESSFLEFVKTGKTSFSDLIDSILDDILQMTIRANITGPMASALSSGGGAFLSGIGSFIGGLFADGAAFSGGVQKFAKGSAFTNSVVSSPTLFPMSSGTGMMGEAGPEAIMPLQRTSSGALGVQSTASAVQLNIVNNTNQEVQASNISESFKQNERGESERIINIVLDGVNRNVNGARDMLKQL